MNLVPCKLLLPPLTLDGKTIDEVGTIVNLSKSDAKALSDLKVVEIVGKNQPEVDRNLPTEEELIHLQNSEQLDGDTSKLSLNTASEEELIALPHLGKSIAQKLIKARPIDSMDKAKALTGLSGDRWSELEGLVTL